MARIEGYAQVAPGVPNTLLILFHMHHSLKILPLCLDCPVKNLGCSGIESADGRVNFEAPPEQANKPLSELFAQAACGLAFLETDKLNRLGEVVRSYSFERQTSLDDIANYAGDSVNYATEASDRLEELNKQRQRR